MIDNPELDKINAPLVKELLARDAVQRVESPLNSLSLGGMKVRDLDKLGSPVFDLINARAKVMFKITTGAKTAVVDDCWATVMYDGA